MSGSPPTSTTCPVNTVGGIEVLARGERERRHSDRPRGPTADEQLLESVESPSVRMRSARPIPGRVLRIMGEFVEGFEKLEHVRDAVAIFGSARTPENDAEYRLAVETARLLAEAGFPIITGGGPGIMEAANRGRGGGGWGLHRL